MVVVALVVVLRRRFGRSVSCAKVVVASILISALASARALVKYRFAPSCTLVVRKPKDEVAI